jgi:F-type H+-transporting ATPase subunit a
VILGLEFPPISHLVEWPDFLFEGTPFGINKVVLIYLFALVATLALFIIGGRKRQLVPSGAQNIAESSVDFIRNGIILQTIGPDGLRKRWILPLLTSMFFFIFFCNITGIVPFIQMPANARMAVPLFLALMV